MKEIQKGINLIMRITKQGYASKPTNNGAVNNDLTKQKNECLTLEEMALSLSKGHSIVFANWTQGEKRQMQFFTSLKHLALDFDNPSLTVEATLSKCEELGLEPALWYYSFSADPENGIEKFRLVFELDREITDPREAKFLILALLKLFPEADQACSDILRLYHGTNKQVEVIGGTVEVEHMIYLTKKYFMELPREGNQKTRQTRAFAQLVGLELVNGLLNIGYDFSEAQWTVSPDEALKLSKTTKRGTVHKKGELVSKETPKRELIKVDYDELCELFPLVGQFLTGKYWADFHELMFLASNLSFFNGGQKRFFDVLETVDFYDNDKNSREYYITTLTDFLNRYENPSPMRWVGAFEEYSDMGTNLVHSYRNSKGNYFRTGSVEKMELKQAQAQLKTILKQVQEAEDGIHIVQVPTSLGKTTGITQMDYTAESMGKTVIMLPTHDLIKQVSDSFYDEILKGNQVAMPANSVERPVHVLPKHDRDKFHYLMSVGAYDSASKLFNKSIRDNKLSDDYEVQEYKQSLVSLKRSHVSLTTHKLGLTQHFVNTVQPETIIIDEDPMMTMLNTNSIKISDLETLLMAVKTIPNNFYMVKYLEELLSLLRVSQQAQQEAIESKGVKFLGSVNKLDKPNFDTAHIIKRIEKWINDGVYVFESPIMELFNGGYWTINVETNVKGITVAKSFTLLQKPQFPVGARKIIVFSATISEMVWKQLYPNAQFYEIGLVENKGTVKQHFISTSKSKMADNAQEIKDILTEEEINNLITFKGTKGYFSEFQTEMHLGNTQGYNSLKGQDIAIAGTFSYPEHILNLIVFAVAGEYPENMNNYKLNINGFRFGFFTFSNPIHRALHIHIIESEMLQAIGRARTIHFDCTVVVASHFPVKEADEFYLKGLRIG